MLSLQPISLTDLILSRLLLVGTDTMTKGDLKNAVKAIAASYLTSSELSDHLDHALNVLSSQEHIQQSGKSRYQITETGQQHIKEILGLEKLPKALQWKTIKDKDWVIYALNLPGLTPDIRKRLDGERLRAAILQSYFELPIDNFSSLTKVRDALLWRQLCEPSVAQRLQAQLSQSSQRFNQGTVMAALLNDLLQDLLQSDSPDSTPKALVWDKALKQLVAKLVRAKRTDPNELRSAILRQAVASALPKLSDALEEDLDDEAFIKTTSHPSSAQVLEPDIPIPEFAKAALKAARTTEERFGDDKVFISQVWRTFQEQSSYALTLDQFKNNLLEANRQHLLTLNRADLSYALNTDDVKTSEISHLSSTFHFIRID